MNTSLLEKRSLGINFHDNASPTIKVWAPHASSLKLVVAGKNDIPLVKMQYGFWQANCPDIEPGDRYKLKVNNNAQFPDPASLSQPEGVHGFSEAINLNSIRTIKDQNWKGISTSDLIIYELHAGTFTPEGTFKALKNKLPYLKDLGINAISLMPVAAFPGERNWGYDGVFPFAVQASYGGAFELAHLVKSCHENGIAVILDVVYNHLGPEGNYLDAFGPYFTGKYNTPWGKAINFDDAWSDGVRQYFLENALMWLRDFHIDGLRLDAVQAIKDSGPKHFLRELSENVQLLNQKTGARHFLIGESDLNDTRYINPVKKDGYGLDAQWCDDWHHALHALVTGERNGYYSGFGQLQHLTKAFNHAFVYNGNYAEYRKRIFGTPTTGQPGSKFVIYTQNHDQVGNRGLGDRISNLVDFETLKLAAAAMIFSPFIPMVFMGEEYAEDHPFLYFISHSDPQLAERVRKGRKREYGDFMKNATPPDPFAEETFQKSKLKWDFNENRHKSQMLAFYKKCIELRKRYHLLKPGNRENALAREIIKDKLLLFSNHNSEMKITAIFNFSDKPVRFETDDLSDFDLLLYSAHIMWGGIVPDNEIPVSLSEDEAKLYLEKKSMVLYKSNKLTETVFS
jgi:maltooligosyltrehalose trehalohydrolase